ncbi:MAG: glycosyltransferase [Verrucomicrobiota bacterium JB022]|nr:glycosyltransferase [Verrucomicrobiota bacterium JB022]
MKILLLTNIPPVVPSSRAGGAQRTSLLLRALEAVGQVDLGLVCAPHYPPRERWEELVALRPEVRRWHWQEPKPFRGAHRIFRRLPQPLHKTIWEPLVERKRYTAQPAVARQVRQYVFDQGYDLVVARYLRPAAVAGLHANDFPVPVLVDVDDLDSEVLRLRLEQEAQISRFIWASHKYRVGKMRQLMLEVLHHSVGAFLVNPADQKLIEPTPSWLLPNIPYHFLQGVIPPLAPPVVESKDLLFVGQLGYEPNRQGLNRFLLNVWPTVMAAVPGVRLRIVGAFIRPEDQEAWGRIEGVDVVGFVDDLRTEYARCAFTVCPVYWGGGSKIKILESLAYGRTCVLTHHAHEGLSQDLYHRNHVWVGDKDDAFAQGCIELLSDFQGRQALAESGREVVDQKFTFSAFCEVVENAVRKAVAKQA